MIERRLPLPQLSGSVFLSDGGLETTLVFIEQVDLPCFAAFPLVLNEEGRATLRRYFEPYLTTAVERSVGFILDTPTWRASADWGMKLGISAEGVRAANRASVAFARDLASEFRTREAPVVVNGVVGPRGDGYRVESQMSAVGAQGYHQDQIEALSSADADLVSAITMTYAEEAIGITRAAQSVGMPVVVSFTVETDGKLPSGETLQSAIERVDAETATAPAYYMINCAHPSHFEDALLDGAWLDRVRGLRANASRKSHAELDEATELDPGDPSELAGQYRALRARLPRLSVLGGCCGTDHRHITAICDACLA